MRVKKDKNNNKVIAKIIPIILILLVASSAVFLLWYKNNQQKLEELRQNNLLQDIQKHYSKYVITNKETVIYQLTDNGYIEKGKLKQDEELTLEEIELTHKDEYLKTNTFEEEYYIYYKDIDKIEELKEKDNRYKKYIVFNKNIVTKDTTNFYNKEGTLIYTFNKSFDLPIIINKKDIYGVEYNNQLLYVKQEDVLEIKDNKNTEQKNTKGIAVLNYHFFFDSTSATERQKCNQIICISNDNFKKHLDYIKKNNIFTPTMEELEMYIDGKIQLPKSVSITIDDGWRASIGSKILTEYELNATVFLMSKDWDPNKIRTDYVEIHSHGHDLHNPGVCPGGQGGGIKCLEKSKLLADLSASREKLLGTTVFCYPFYEYNDYSIKVLKEAGFTMAFGGYGEAGKYKAAPGVNKFKIPRYVIYSYTTANQIKSYIG